jgi:hypothetical protein
LRERSHEFNDEKRLDTLISGALFAPERLDLDLLATYREPPPLAYRRLGDGDTIIVIENSDTYATLRRLLASSPGPTLEKITEREQAVAAQAETARTQIEQLTGRLREMEAEPAELATARKVVLALDQNEDENTRTTGLLVNPLYQHILAILADAGEPRRTTPRPPSRPAPRNTAPTTPSQPGSTAIPRAPCGRRRQAGVPRALAATAQKAHRSPRPEFIPGTASSTRKFLTQKSGP